MDKMTFFKARQWAFSFANTHNKETSGVELLLLGQMHWSVTQLLVHFHDVMPDQEWQTFQTNVQRYCLEDYPPQYLLGEADFFGLKLAVSPATLIPRLETEELVEWILAEHSSKPHKVLDLGTGTGAIGLALKQNRPQWEVTLADISSAALTVARKNAEALALPVTLINSDLFADIRDDDYDIIVSNPPYISPTERPLMDQSVLQYEPALALFAADDGLAVYKKIAHQVQAHLQPAGMLYLEIGFKQGPAVKTLFEQEIPTSQVVVRQDISQNDRMVRVKMR